MANNKNKYDWLYFENFYKENIQRGQTFSYDMGEIIEAEIEKMKKQRVDYLNNKKDGKNDSDKVDSQGD